ncbi:TIGR03767 family metallophosphoesterase [Actinoplanes subtropicus]|uniref:TIGR03767 family metallophosphoesterase n=1 Tax=Actinoplanes subtropicus TaxID=543632 RepID=UPI0006896405|nr:TIGR03767 family metallophosphoesterase [Actinoplanes subtropicus]
MAISRRGFLVAAGASVAATVLDVAWAEAEPAAAAGSALTTLDGTVVLGAPDPANGNYRRIQTELGPGEQFVVRSDLTIVTSAPVTNVVAAFAQMTDLHIVDDQSPLRVEFLDAYANPGPPHFATYPTAASYRPQESMSTQVVDAMCRAIRKAGHGPKTLLPLAFTIVTGDAVDNCQYNEVRWYINLLDGVSITPNSGLSRAYDTSVTSDGFTMDINYWHPSMRQFELTNTRGPGLDLYFQGGFPDVLNLPYQARRTFQATGLGMPWYAAYGNHDALVQGNLPIGYDLFGLNVEDLATGNFKPSMILGIPDTLTSSAGDIYDLATAGIFHDMSGLQVPADPDRRLLGRGQFVQEHFTTAGLPVGHGFSRGTDRAYYVIPDAQYDQVRHIVLDTSYTGGGPNGWLDDGQFGWLESLLKANSSRYLNVASDGEHTLVTQPGVVDKLFVIYSHHTSGTMGNPLAMHLENNAHSGTDLTNLLLRFPNVVLWVNGHNHKNKIVSHLSGFVAQTGFWEVTTASHIDWPYQSRILEITEGDGTLSVFTTMVDIDAPLDWRGLDLNAPATLAALSREIAANDLQQRGTGVVDRPGSPQDRNTQLLVPAPFAFAPALRARTTTPITAVARNADRIDVFAARYDGATMANWWSAGTGAWAGWSQIGGGFANGGGPGSPITSVHRAGGTRVEVFTVGDGDRVYTSANEAGQAWTGWSEVPGGLICRPGSTVTAISRSPDKIDLFTTAANGAIMSTWWNTAGGWPGYWFQVSGGTAAAGATVTAIARSANHIDVFVVGDGNVVWSNFWDGATGWYGWFKVPGTPVCRPDSAVTVIARDPDKLDLFTVASNGAIMSTWWNSSGGWPGSWFQVSGGFAAPGSQVSAVARSATHIDLFTVGANGQAESTFWDVSSGWYGWFPLGQRSFPGSQVAVVCRTPGTIDVFSVSAGGADPLPSGGRSVAGVVNSRWPVNGTWPVAWSTVKNGADAFPPPVIVPNLVGKDTQTALSMIGDLGLNARVDANLTKDCNDPADVVIKQSPTPGAYNLPPGSTIAITVPNHLGCPPDNK